MTDKFGASCIAIYFGKGRLTTPRDDTNGGEGWCIQREFAAPIMWFLTYGEASDMQIKHALRNDPVLLVPANR